MKNLTVQFYSSASGNEPVRKWLKELSKENKIIIGEDLKTVEYGWPLSMPLVRKMDVSLWEVRSNINNGEIARVLFTVLNGTMVLLHGFIKKSKKTPMNDLNIAKNRRDHALNERIVI